MKVDDAAQTVAIVVIAAAAIIMAAIVGLTIVDEVSIHFTDNNELHDRAEAVYGDDYRIVSSNQCWDICVTTATTIDQQKADILRVLRRRGGFVSKTALMAATAGTNLDEPLRHLEESGTIETRRKAVLVGEIQYRYVDGAESVTSLSDEQVRQRVRRRLYVTGAAMTVEAIANDLPVGETRVRVALEQLDSAGKVNDGYVYRGFIGTRMWIDTRHGTLPDGRFDSSWLVRFPVILAGLLGIGMILRFKTGRRVQCD